MSYYASATVPGCTASRGEDSYFTPSHWAYCAFDSDHYHDGFIVPGIWQTKSRKWLGVTQGIWGGMWQRVGEKGCVCVCVCHRDKEMETSEDRGRRVQRVES